MPTYAFESTMKYGMRNLTVKILQSNCNSKELNRIYYFNGERRCVPTAYQRIRVNITILHIFSSISILHPFGN